MSDPIDVISWICDDAEDDKLTRILEVLLPNEEKKLNRLRSENARLQAERDEAVKLLQYYLRFAPAFTMMPIGAPGSRERDMQNLHIETEKKVEDFVRKLQQSSSDK